MKFTRDIRIRRKRRKAERNLEKMLRQYSHNDVVLQLQVTNYLHRFCRDDRGEVYPNAFIQSYITRVEENMRRETG